MILVISPKKSFASKRLLNEAENLKIGIKIISAQDFFEQGLGESLKQFKLLYVRNPYVNGSARYVEEVIKLAKRFELSGKVVVDSVVTSDMWGKGKFVDYGILRKNNLPIPKTEKLTLGMVIKYPVVAKWIYGQKGRGTILLQNAFELKKVRQEYPPDEMLVQELISKAVEYKVVTVGFKSIPVVLRFAASAAGFGIDFKQATFVNFRDVPEVVSLAERASKVLGRELSKTDILESGGKYYILEVNRFPGLKSFEKLSGVNVFRYFATYLQNKSEML